MSTISKESMVRQDKESILCALLGLGCFLAVVYAILSANCATGGSCDFASGDFANWLFTKLTDSR